MSVALVRDIDIPLPLSKNTLSFVLSLPASFIPGDTNVTRSYVVFVSVVELPISEKLVPSLVYCHLSVVSFQRSDTLVDVPLSISIPPFCEGALVSSLFRTSILSPMFTVLLLIVVVVPLTIRLPVIVRSLLIVASPVTTRVEPSKVRFPSACKAVPLTPVTILLFALLAIVTPPGTG